MKLLNMYKITRTIFLIFLMFIALNKKCALAQENFIPGYIIQNSVDSIKGYIDYRNWDNNPNQILFKENLTDESKSYSSTEISEFGVNNEIYVSALVDVVTSSYLSQDTKLNTITENTFLYCLYKGEKSLYMHSRDGRDYFYIPQMGRYDLLIYWKYSLNKDGKYFIQENKKFIGQLMIYFSNCPELSSIISNLNYDKKSLLKLYKFYYNKYTSLYFKGNEKNKVEVTFGGVLGTTISSVGISIYSFDASFDPKMIFATSLNASMGFFMDFEMISLAKDLSLYSELLYTSFRVQGTLFDYHVQNTVKLFEYDLGLAMLKLNIMLRKSNNIGVFNLFVNAGTSYGIILNEQNETMLTEYVNGDKSYLTLRGLNNNRLMLGIMAGFGVEYRRVSLDARIEFLTGNIFYSSNKNISGILSYRF